jgi:hypothetical protein
MPLDSLSVVFLLYFLHHFAILSTINHIDLKPSSVAARVFGLMAVIVTTLLVDAR